MSCTLTLTLKVRPNESVFSFENILYRSALLFSLTVYVVRMVGTIGCISGWRLCSVSEDELVASGKVRLYSVVAEIIIKSAVI